MKHKIIYNNREFLNCSVNEYGIPILAMAYNDSLTLDSSKLTKPFKFTGKKDSDGNEIYEGHKLKITVGEIIKRIYPPLIVIWDEKRCGFYCKSYKGDTYQFGDPMFYPSNQLKIVGHINIQEEN